MNVNGIGSQARSARTYSRNANRVNSPKLPAPNSHGVGQIRGLTRSMPAVKTMRMRGAGNSSYKGKKILRLGLLIFLYRKLMILSNLF